jgi:oligoendopeptidase F
MEIAPVPSRDEIAPAHLWNLRHIYDNNEAWQIDFARVEEMIDSVSSLEGTLGDSPGSLTEALRSNADLGESLDKVFVYANLLRDEDTRDASAQAMAERASRLATRVAEATSFVEPEILAIPRDTLESFLQSRELSPWRHYLENLLRLKEHTLSPREEQILAMAGDVTRTPRTAFGMLNDADLTFRAIQDEQGREVELTKGRYSSFMESPDRRVRRDAWTSLTDAYESHRNTVSALLSGSVKRDVFYARARGYASSLVAALDPSNIPTEVFHTLIDVVRKRRAAFHRYSTMRKEILGLDDLRIYDLYVPLSNSRGPTFSYDEARELLVEGSAAFGHEYVSALREGLESGWIDVFETRGKRSGAYSWGSYGTHPYVLMNYHGTLDHLFTFTHEMGHAMHHYYTARAQPYVYSHYPIFLAEVASTTSESVLMSHLLEVTKDPARKLALLNQSIDQIRGTVITQVMFAEFEHRMHTMVEDGEPLTADTLSGLYREVFTSTLGPELSFDDRAALGWARIPHFYTGYYVYQYATGYSAAIALSRRVLQGGEREREDYLGFLRAGNSDYPIEILKRAGVDLTTADPINDTLDLFESLLDQLEEHISRYGAASASRG